MERFQTVSFILISLTLFFKIITVCGGQCLDDQASLLLQFKQNLSFSPVAYFSYSGDDDSGDFETLSFSPTGRLSSWNSSSDCCWWNGVTCDEMSGNVIGLDLTNQSISGGIDNSSALFHLQHLQTFNLAFNPFNFTTIPSGFNRLTKLTHLNFSTSSFTGQIPIEISHIKSLVSLDLGSIEFITEGYNNLKLVKPNLKELVGNMSSLRVLVLDGVNISAHGREWCRAVSALPKLQVLSLRNCYLTGHFDPSLSNLNFLMKLRLAGNNLSSQVPEFFGRFSNLTVLDLWGCGLYGKFPERVFLIQSLKSIDLSFNVLLQGSLPDFPQNGSLLTLDLRITNFSGSLPFSIGNLKFLSRLDLLGCGFNGLIPLSISNLRQLQYLDISYNNLTGVIPSTLFSLPLLEEIYLYHNQFTQLSEFSNGSTSMLKYLHLSRNLLTGEIPSGIYALPNIEWLELSWNNLSGEIPSMIFAPPNLKFLDLSWNNLSGSLDMFQKFEHLSVLKLSGNALTMKMDNSLSWFSQLDTIALSSCNLKAIPGFLRNQSQLEDLDISNNQIYGKFPKKNFNTSFKNLNLSHNFLEGVQLGPQGLMYTIDLSSNLLQGSLSRLPLSAEYYLDYSKNNIASIIPNNIGSYLTNTSFLSFSSNRLTGEIPASICDSGNLQILDLSNNNLSGRIPICFGSMKSLVILNLKSNHFHGSIPNTFLSGCHLETLDLNGNKIEGGMPRSLENCRSLQVLDVGNNQLNDKFPSWLTNLLQLRVIVMRSNNFHGCIGRLENGSTFPMLQIIDLSSNNFTCNLPTEYILGWKAMHEESLEDDQILRSTLDHGILDYQDTVTVTMKGLEMELVKILTVSISIDLSNNRFDGEIPDVIGDLVLLISLNFSSNALTGPIPESFGKLKQLESLDLSRNKLEGEIPMSLAGLTSLEVLNLAFNQLIGEIPTGSQLQTFNEDSFEGNAGLCGFPLLKKCEDNVPKAPPPNVNSEEDSCNVSLFQSCSDGEPNWLMIITSLGFGVGNGLAICMIVFCKPLNQWYRRLQFEPGR